MKKTKNRKGFTLIETVMSVIVFGIIFFAVGQFVFLGYRTKGYVYEQSRAVSEARRGVEAMARDIRSAETAEDGSFAIERADDKQFVFYSDIDKDGVIEKVRYFLGTISAGNDSHECSTATRGGSCSVSFSNFFTGDLKSAQVRFYTDGDLDSSSEYVSFSADGVTLDDDVCKSGCVHCAASWQGSVVFDVTQSSMDNFLQFTADSSYDVQNQCPAASPNHSMKARFELSWAEEVIGMGNELKRGVIEPSGDPATYSSNDEQVSLVTSYVRNDPPIFKYFDSDGNEITDLPARLNDVKMVKVFLVVNIDPNRLPDEYQLEEFVELRNLKEE
jgi:prepilin-type N-terminal cleavage/methylation domain-containing protein